MLRYNVQQKLGSGAGDSVSCWKGWSRGSICTLGYSGEMSLPRQDEVGQVSMQGFAGLLQARHIIGILILLKEHRKGNTSTPGLKKSLFWEGQALLGKIRRFMQIMLWTRGFIKEAWVSPRWVVCSAISLLLPVSGCQGVSLASL